MCGADHCEAPAWRVSDHSASCRCFSVGSLTWVVCVCEKNQSRELMCGALMVRQENGVCLCGTLGSEHLKDSC